MNDFTKYNALPHLPLGSGILLCRDVCPRPTESMDMVTDTGRVVLGSTELYSLSEIQH